MGLRNDIEKLAELLPSSHTPGPAETGKLVSALLAYAEHGNAIIDAAVHGAEHVAALLGTSVPSEWERIRYAAEHELPQANPTSVVAAPVVTTAATPVASPPLPTGAVPAFTPPPPTGA